MKIAGVNSKYGKGVYLDVNDAIATKVVDKTVKAVETVGLVVAGAGLASLLLGGGSSSRGEEEQQRKEWEASPAGIIHARQVGILKSRRFRRNICLSLFLLFLAITALAATMHFKSVLNETVFFVADSLLFIVLCWAIITWRPDESPEQKAETAAWKARPEGKTHINREQRDTEELIGFMIKLFSPFLLIYVLFGCFVCSMNEDKKKADTAVGASNAAIVANPRYPPTDPSIVCQDIVKQEQTYPGQEQYPLFAKTFYGFDPRHFPEVAPTNGSTNFFSLDNPVRKDGSYIDCRGRRWGWLEGWLNLSDCRLCQPK